jgi:membrane protein YqaA with SNARE-associated domain
MSVPVRQTSSLAVISLVSGILGWTLVPFLGSLVAIVTGHLARKEIRRNAALDGDAMAIIGLVLGWVAVIGTVLAILAFVLFFGGLAWLGTR